MMKSAANIVGPTIAQRMPRGENRSARRQPKRIHHSSRIGNLELENFVIGQRAIAKPCDPAAIVREKQVLELRRSRRDEIRLIGESLRQHPFADQLELHRRKDVIANIEIVARMINQLEGEHDCSAVITATL